MFSWILLEAFGWGILSAISLPLGVVVGWIKVPSIKARAAFMAFGGGALLYALSIELFGQTLCEEEIEHTAVVPMLITGLVMAFAAIGEGGLLYEFLDRQLNKMGAFMRKLSASIVTVKYISAPRLLYNLKQMKVFRHIPDEQLFQVTSFVKWKNVEEGKQVFGEIDENTPLFFIVSGKVAITFQDGSNDLPLIYEKHELFGERNYLYGETRKARAVALEDTKLIKLKRKKLEKLVTAVPLVKDALLRVPKKEGNAHVPVPEFKSTTSSGALLPLNEDTQETPQNDLTVTSENEIELSTIREKPTETDTEELLRHSDPHHSKNAHGHKSQGGHVALAIWLGILIDGIPESMVIGIMTSKTGISAAFLVGVFLSNFPEALSSSLIMQEQGMSKKKVLMMWMSICIMTGIGALFGALIFGKQVSGPAVFVMKGIEGVAGGAMLVMIAKTMLPEAFMQGGNISGIATLLGFLSAHMVKVTEQH